MFKSYRRRFWVEIALASASAVLCMITLIWPDWIEAASGWDPDLGRGTMEWLICGGLSLVSATAFAAAGIERRRQPVAASC
jgi:hypothetical protein